MAGMENAQGLLLVELRCLLQRLLAGPTAADVRFQLRSFGLAELLVEISFQFLRGWAAGHWLTCQGLSVAHARKRVFEPAPHPHPPPSLGEGGGGGPARGLAGGLVGHLSHVSCMNYELSSILLTS